MKRKTLEAPAPAERTEASSPRSGDSPRPASPHRHPILAGLLTSFVILVVGVIVIELQPTRYAVTSTVSFGPRSVPNVSAEVVQLAATKYAVTAGATTTLDFAADRSSMTSAELRDNLSVSVQHGTANVNIVVKDSDPVQGAKAANAIASSVARATDNDELILGEVTAPADPDAARRTPSRALLLTVTVVAAVLAAGWVAFGVRHLDKRAARESR